MIDPTQHDTNDLLTLIDVTQHRPGLPPDMAREIASAITSRSVAQSMVDTVLARDPFKQVDFAFWVGEHIRATKKLAAFGIDLVTYQEVA